MRKLHILTALLIVLTVGGLSVSPTKYVQMTRAHAAIDATAVWNHVCEDYGFATAPSAGGSFADNWNSNATIYSTAQSALDACSHQVSIILGTPDPGWGDGDLFNASIENWPEE